jgi:Holliday junction resolvasome RuvABC endonuclease subunit
VGIAYRDGCRAVEGYAMGAKGQVFQIAENTGLLKHKLWLTGIPFVTPAPTAVKKHATGKGNAKKEDMERAFVEETGWDIRHELGQSAKSWNPSSDIIDAYFMARFGHTQTKTQG